MISTTRMKEELIDLLFPRCCPVCGEITVPGKALICSGCIGKLSFVRQPCCKKCGKEVLSDAVEYCYDCSRHPKTFEYGIALLNYNETAKTSMARIKYRNKREYLDFYSEAIAKRMGKKLKRIRADVLVPVPVHLTRKRERGFNQAEVLAEKLGKRLNLPVLNGYLIRDRNTAPQKQLNPKERLKNLEQAFTARPFPDMVQSVILVDDIYTTGSTAEACSRVLKRAGVKQIYVLSICIGQGD